MIWDKSTNRKTFGMVCYCGWETYPRSAFKFDGGVTGKMGGFQREGDIDGRG